MQQCTPNKPICFRKKKNRWETSTKDCQNNDLVIGSRLEKVYNLGWSPDKDKFYNDPTYNLEKEGCVRSITDKNDPYSFDKNDPTIEDECFCSTVDYAWINYIREAQKRLDKFEEELKQPSLETKNDALAEENIRIIRESLQETNQSGKLPVNFTDIIEKIIDIAKKRWHLPEDDPILLKMNQVLVHIKSAEISQIHALQEQDQSPAESQPILTDESIISLKKAMESVVETEIKKTMLNVNKVVRDIFEIGLRVLNPLDNNAMNDILDRLNKNLEAFLPPEEHELSTTATHGGRKYKKMITKKYKRKSKNNNKPKGRKTKSCRIKNNLFGGLPNKNVEKQKLTESELLQLHRKNFTTYKFTEEQQKFRETYDDNLDEEYEYSKLRDNPETRELYGNLRERLYERDYFRDGKLSNYNQWLCYQKWKRKGLYKHYLNMKFLEKVQKNNDLNPLKYKAGIVHTLQNYRFNRDTLSNVQDEILMFMRFLVTKERSKFSKILLFTGAVVLRTRNNLMESVRRIIPFIGTFLITKVQKAQDWVIKKIMLGSFDKGESKNQVKIKCHFPKDNYTGDRGEFQYNNILFGDDQDPDILEKNTNILYKDFSFEEKRKLREEWEKMQKKEKDDEENSYFNRISKAFTRKKKIMPLNFTTTSSYI
jgi:hypothetical protein